jgi:rare lipoprotein A
MASGKVYLSSDVAAAHPSLPFNTWLCVKNLNNGRFVKVEVLDRGPFTGGRILDLTSRAADALEMKGSGVVPIEMRVLGFQSDSCGEPDVAQQCRSTLEAWHDVRDGGDVLHVTVDARCTAAKVSVYLGSRDMTRSRGTAEEPLQVDELGKQKQAVVDLSALREEDPQKIFEAARVELVDASGRVLYRTGFEGRPSPLLKPLQRSEVCRDNSGTVDAARSALEGVQDSDHCPAPESQEAAAAP